MNSLLKKTKTKTKTKIKLVDNEIKIISFADFQRLKEIKAKPKLKLVKN